MVERILQKLQELGLTANAAEKKLGFGNGAIKRFATSSPSIDKIISLSNLLNVSIDWIVTGKEHADNSSQTKLTEQEQLLLDTYRSMDEIGRMRVMQTALNEHDRIKFTHYPRKAIDFDDELDIAASGKELHTQKINRNGKTPEEIAKELKESIKNP